MLKIIKKHITTADTIEWNVWLPAGNSSEELVSWIPDDPTESVFPMTSAQHKVTAEISAINVPAIGNRDDIWGAVSAGKNVDEMMYSGFNVVIQNLGVLNGP